MPTSADLQKNTPGDAGWTPALCVWMEIALRACTFVLPPLLVLVPRGAAALAGLAGLCAALLVGLARPCRLAALRFPAAMLGLLLLWGALSAVWSIDPWRSLLIDARLAGLLAAGLALAAAAGRLDSPSSLVRAMIAGTIVGLALAAADLVSAGELTHLVSIRQFAGPRLDQIAAWFAFLALPVGALLVSRQRWLPGLLATGIAVTAVFLLYDSTAKIALAAGLSVSLLCHLRLAMLARVAALVSVIIIVTAPVTLPRLALLPGVFHAADAYKVSAGHRLLIWSFTGDRIAERPFLGWGLDSARAIPGGKDEIRPGQSWLPLHPHDAALQVWLELGAPGAALFALFVGFLWLRLAAAPWPPLFAAAAGGSLTAVLVLALAGWGIWEEWWIATQCIAISAVIAMGRAATDPLQVIPPRRRGWRAGDR